MIQGTGWLALGRYVVTCAHVVDDALKRKRGSVEWPDEAIRVDLPFLGKMGLAGRVVAWFPARPLSDLVRDPLADVAVLELQDDSRIAGGIEPAAVDRRIPPRETGFLTYGFPTGFDNGAEASGEVLVQDPGGWLQVRDTQGFGYFIQPGFSGAPVVSQADLRLIGMATAADRDKTTRLAFLLPAQLICRAFPPLAMPYRGLFAFGEEDADLFFGRGDFVAQFQTKLERHTFTAVIGPSGSGKSSVVLAGLAPLLRAAGWNVAVCRPLRDPLLQLGLGLASLTKPNPADFSARIGEAEEWARRLREDPRRIVDLARQIGDTMPGRQTRTLVVIDQFEELFTQDAEAPDGAAAREVTLEGGSPRQAQFLAVLEAIAAQDPDSSPIRAVATMRVDFMGHALAIRRLAGLLQDTDVKLGPMTAAELSEAVRRPARTFGVEFEDGLAEELVTAMQGRAGGLPLLEFTLDRLWRRQEGRRLTWAAYRGPDGKGGLETALDEHAEGVLRRLGEAPEAGVQRLMLRLVQLGEDGAPDARAVVRRSEIGKADWPLVQKLADGRSRLLTVGRDAATGEETAEVVHEALIGAWGRLRGWLLEDRDFGLWRQRLKESLQTWSGDSEDYDPLLRGRLLTEASDWLDKRGADLNQRESNFIKASQEHARMEAEEDLRQAQERERLANELAKAAQAGERAANELAEAAHEREIAAKQLAEARRLALVAAEAAAKRQKRAIQVLAAAAAAIALSSPFFFERFDESRMRAAMLSAARTRIDDGRPVEAAPFAVAAASLTPAGTSNDAKSETENLLKDSGVAFRLRKAFPDGAAEKKHRVSPDGSRLLLQAGNFEASLWNVQSGEKMRAFGPIDRWLAYFNEQRVVTISLSNEVSIWSLVDGALVRALGEKNRAKTLYDVGADDVFVAVSDEYCTLWSVRSGAEIAVLGDSDTCEAVTLTKKFVVTRSKQKEGTVRDHAGSKVFVFPKGCQVCGLARNGKYAYSINSGSLATYRLPSFVEASEIADAKVAAVEYSQDGGRLATINAYGQVSLWELNNGRASVLADRFALATWAEFSPDSTILITQNKDYSGRISSGQDGSKIVSFFPGELIEFKFTPESHILSMMFANRFVSLWDTLNAKEILRLPGAGKLLTMLFSPDHTRVAISSADKPGYLWDLRQQRKLTDFDRVGADSGRESKFSGNSRRYVSHSWDLGASIWDAVSGDAIGRLGGPSTVAELETSKDGTIILTVDPNSGAALWDASNIRRSAEISDVKAHVCNENRDFMQFTASQRIDFVGLIGRPWNPCDWERSDSVEGSLQAIRRWGIRSGIIEDYECNETAAFSNDKAERRAVCTTNN
ncbi:trypsin-like peptidase domain-containing protein [Sinorhizobium fredii]|uniref:nSTAND1 domain-containing NTPase n=1 Tax=Rhizobium fredii TaxID=380 RepID=UPI0004B208F3|nr:trypsin-like peptidase domain-containing protein [Sinorhizobium fredii]